MNKIKLLWNKVRQTAIFKAFVIWIVVVIALVFMVDKLLMPAFAGAFASTGTVPNLEGLSEQAADSVLKKAGFKYEWTEEDSWDALTDGMYGDMPTDPLMYDAMMESMGF